MYFPTATPAEKIDITAAPIISIIISSAEPIVHIIPFTKNSPLSNWLCEVYFHINDKKTWSPRSFVIRGFIKEIRYGERNSAL